MAPFQADAKKPTSYVFSSGTNPLSHSPCTIDLLKLMIRISWTYPINYHLFKNLTKIHNNFKFITPKKKQKRGTWQPFIPSIHIHSIHETHLKSLWWHARCVPGPALRLPPARRSGAWYHRGIPVAVDPPKRCTCRFWEFVLYLGEGW